MEMFHKITKKTYFLLPPGPFKLPKNFSFFSIAPRFLGIVGHHLNNCFFKKCLALSNHAAVNQIDLAFI